MSEQVEKALASLPEEARAAAEKLGIADEQHLPVLGSILQEVGVAGLCAWVAYQDVLEGGSVDAFDMGEILAAALPALERTIRSDERSKVVGQVRSILKEQVGEYEREANEAAQRGEEHGAKALRTGADVVRCVTTIVMDALAYTEAHS